VAIRAPLVLMFRHLFDRRIQHDETVTICIPAWRAEDFIERTLRCALEQTHAKLRILVSVDYCEDATVPICETLARADSRIEVFPQRERLGWAGNVNFLLERVQSPFFFLYFHDDIVLPPYTERLLKALRKRPDAMSAHCDMGHFGASNQVSIGCTYNGSAARRLATFLVAPERGSPLRSLTRSEILSEKLRMPTTAAGGFWANEPYLMRLLAAGPAVRVPKVLYLRWDQRKDSLTEGWKTLSPAHVVSGFQANIAAALAIIAEATSPAERDVLVFCLYVHMMLRVRDFEHRVGISAIGSAEDLHPVFANQSIPAALADFGPDIKHWTMRRYRRLVRLEERAADRIWLA
jgi:glycosyltransferase involved in cell wall biosynthesis